MKLNEKIVDILNRYDNNQTYAVGELVALIASECKEAVEGYIRRECKRKAKMYSDKLVVDGIVENESEKYIKDLKGDK